ncbi:RidA family protein [uncultured Tateyamaria sp.]|uniref:RidA family protein n=1 Tax=uncultured Tateyamaria sp. TaxID=455651 RepID=UPI0026255242|nr:RidA family protein [uncultured Tateyamaria sp.]
MTDIKRFDTDHRMSQAVVHGNTVYLAGQCGTAHAPIQTQTREALSKIDHHLATVGTDKAQLLSVTIWLSSIADYDAVNAVWDAWVAPGTAPARSCGEVQIGGEGYNIEIICTAALS